MPGPNINPTYSRKGEYNEIPEEILSYIRSQRGNTGQQGNQTSYTKTPQTGSGGLGTLEYNVPYTGRLNMPAVPNPDKAFGDIALNQYKQTQRDFLPFEQAIMQTIDDTSLVDAVPEDVKKQTRISKEVAERNRQRYGYEQTAVEASESQRASQRGEALNLAGGMNTARLAQRERNRGLLADLINIGQDQNRSSLSMLGTAAENATMRANAFRQAQAQAKSQKISMIGSAMMTAAMFI